MNSPSVNVQTHLVTINPGYYNGFYALNPPNVCKGWKWISGINMVTLPAGLHSFSVGVKAFTFVVGAEGLVSNVSNPQAAEVGADGISLHLKTVPVTFDPGSYGQPGNPGRYYLQTYERHCGEGYPGEGLRGKQTVELLPGEARAGVHYGVDNSSHIGSSATTFGLSAAAGNVTITKITPQSAATAESSATLRFKTATMRIEMGKYKMQYLISTFLRQPFQTPQQVDLILGLTLGITIGNLSGDEPVTKPTYSNYFYVTVDANGFWHPVGRLSTGGLFNCATFKDNVLTLLTVKVTIAPLDVHTGPWWISADGNNEKTGTLTMELVPSLLYVISITNSRRAHFRLPEPGAPTLTVNCAGFLFEVTVYHEGEGPVLDV